jgi:hypothetical protein
MHSKLLTLVLAIGLACGSSSCAQDDENRDPVTPSPSVTEVFAGTLARNGGRTHDFSVAATGPVQARLSKLTGLEGAALADPATTVGFTLGTWNGTSCTAVTAADRAAQNTVIGATAGSAGRLCVRLYDAAGTLGETIEYEITVVHP